MKKAQKTIAGLLYFFMAVVIIALFMPVVRTAISSGIEKIGNDSNSVLMGWIYTYWPVYCVVMLLVILVIILK